MSSPPALQLNPDIDIDACRRRYVERGRALIADLLAGNGAKRILTCLEMEKRWDLVTDSGGKHVHFNAAETERLPADAQAKLLSVVHRQAATGFQYLYASYPVSDVFHGGGAPGHFLNEVFVFLNSAPVLDLVRAITGDDEIGHADAHATRYGRGHFLTEHDDSRAGADRRAAYVLGLTPKWRPDWGGLTLFTGEDGGVDEAFPPGFNSLLLFRVPQPHAVSVVAPFAPAPRFAITGWMQAGPDPKGPARA